MSTLLAVLERSSGGLRVRDAPISGAIRGQLPLEAGRRMEVPIEAEPQLSKIDIA
jgi:hypothetical protein